MSHMTKTSPWLVNYFVRSLQTRPNPPTLHACYVQAISSVSQRRELLVFDGQFSARAVLAWSAISTIEADEEETGVGIKDLCGYLIAVKEVKIVPDLGNANPEAILVIKDMALFTDRVTMTPDRTRRVETHSAVSNVIRSSIASRMSEWASAADFCRGYQYGGKHIPSDAIGMPKRKKNFISNQAALDHNLEPVEVAPLREWGEEDRQTAKEIPGLREAAVRATERENSIQCGQGGSQDRVGSLQNNADVQHRNTKRNGDILSVEQHSLSNQIDTPTPPDNVLTQREHSVSSPERVRDPTKLKIDNGGGENQNDRQQDVETRMTSKLPGDSSTRPKDNVGVRKETLLREDSDEDADWIVSLPNPTQEQEKQATDTLPQTQHYTCADDDFDDEDNDESFAQNQENEQGPSAVDDLGAQIFVELAPRKKSALLGGMESTKSPVIPNAPESAAQEPAKTADNSTNKENVHATEQIPETEEPDNQRDERTMRNSESVPGEEMDHAITSNDIFENVEKSERSGAGVKTQKNRRNEDSNVTSETISDCLADLDVSDIVEKKISVRKSNKKRKNRNQKNNKCISVRSEKQLIGTVNTESTNDKRPKSVNGENIRVLRDESNPAFDDGTKLLKASGKRSLRRDVTPSAYENVEAMVNGNFLSEQLISPTKRRKISRSNFESDRAEDVHTSRIEVIDVDAVDCDSITPITVYQRQNQLQNMESKGLNSSKSIGGNSSVNISSKLPANTQKSSAISIGEPSEDVNADFDEMDTLENLSPNDYKQRKVPSHNATTPTRTKSSKPKRLTSDDKLVTEKDATMSCLDEGWSPTKNLLGRKRRYGAKRHLEQNLNSSYAKRTERDSARRNEEPNSAARSEVSDPKMKSTEAKDNEKSVEKPPVMRKRRYGTRKLVEGHVESNSVLGESAGAKKSSAPNVQSTKDFIGKDLTQYEQERTSIEHMQKRTLVVRDNQDVSVILNKSSLQKHLHATVIEVCDAPGKHGTSKVDSSIGLTKKLKSGRDPLKITSGDQNYMNVPTNLTNSNKFNHENGKRNITTVLDPSTKEKGNSARKSDIVRSLGNENKDEVLRSGFGSHITPRKKLRPSDRKSGSRAKRTFDVNTLQTIDRLIDKFWREEQARARTL